MQGRRPDPYQPGPTARVRMRLETEGCKPDPCYLRGRSSIPQSSVSLQTHPSQSPPEQAHSLKLAQLKAYKSALPDH